MARGYGYYYYIESNGKAVASLGWVTPGAAAEGVTPLFFMRKKTGNFFSHPRLCQFCGVTPVYFLLKTDDFLAHHFHFLLISLWRVSPGAVAS